MARKTIRGHLFIPSSSSHPYFSREKKLFTHKSLLFSSNYEIYNYESANCLNISIFNLEKENLLRKESCNLNWQLCQHNKCFISMFFSAYQIVIEENSRWNFKLILIMLSYKSLESLNQKTSSNIKCKDSFLTIIIYYEVTKHLHYINASWVFPKRNPIFSK